MQKFLALLLVSFVFIVLPSLAQDQRDTTPPQSGISSITVMDGVPYGSANGDWLRLDIYNPSDGKAKNRPAVVLIHGGGWTSFDKGTMRGMGDFLARSGFVAFSIDYRLFKNEEGKAENRWPAQLDDVQRAVRWIRANAAKYSVDPERIGAFGHSAGAQLAALLGMEDTRDKFRSGPGEILKPRPGCRRCERPHRLHNQSRPRW